MILRGNNLDASNITNIFVMNHNGGTPVFRWNNTSATKQTLVSTFTGADSLYFGFSNATHNILYYQECGLFEGEITENDFTQYYPPNTEITKINESLDGLENDVLTLQDVSLKGGVYAGDDGNFINLNNYMCSNDFIEITPNTHFKLLLNEDNDDYGLLLYDKDKNYLGRSNSFLYTSGNLIEGIIPQNAYYAIINIHLYNGNFPTVYLYTTKIGKVVNQLKNDLTAVKSNFQDGVDSVYNAIVSAGTTPSSKSLPDVVDGIGTLSTNRYNDVKTDYNPTEATLTDDGALTVTNAAGTTRLTKNFSNSFNTAKSNFYPTGINLDLGGIVSVINCYGQIIQQQNFQGSSFNAGYNQAKAEYQPVSFVRNGQSIFILNSAGAVIYSVPIS